MRDDLVMLPNDTIRHRSFRWSSFCLLLCLVSFIADRAFAQGADDASSYAEHATLAVQSMQRLYELNSGLYKTTGWWNAANLITVLADFSRIQRVPTYDFVFSNTYSVAQKKNPGFINEYYDDEGWWALAWIDAYQNTQDPRFLETAGSIFRDMTYGWDDTCAGGIWWSKERKYKNAIANELFLSVAAKLALVTRDPGAKKEYLAWAHKEWAWFLQSGMINEQSLINDGLDGKCKNNGKTTWTYNQGVLLGGLAALSRSDHSVSLAVADRVAGAAIANLTDSDGVLHESCEPNCGADGTQFKGIFVRNLRELYEGRSHVAAYGAFLLTNARSIWSLAQGPDYRFGEVWNATTGVTNASTQGSALDALVAAIVVARQK